MKPLKDTLLKLKKKSGLTWKLLAREVGVEPNTLHLWSNGFVKSMKPESEARLDDVLKKWSVK